MATGGFWSLPPGDVSAGCRTDTPDTWTASAGGAALVPAPRYHGNLPCSETLVHLVGRVRPKKENRGKKEGGCVCNIQMEQHKHETEENTQSLMLTSSPRGSCVWDHDWGGCWPIIGWVHSITQYRCGCCRQTWRRSALHRASLSACTLNQIHLH